MWPHSWCCAEPCPAQVSPRGRGELSCPQAPTATPRPLQATFFPPMTSSPGVLVPLPPLPAPLTPGCRLGLPAQLSLVSLRAATRSPEFLYSPCPSRKMIHKKHSQTPPLRVAEHVGTGCCAGHPLGTRLDVCPHNGGYEDMGAQRTHGGTGARCPGPFLPRCHQAMGTDPHPTVGSRCAGCSGTAQSCPTQPRGPVLLCPSPPGARLLSPM